MKYLFNKTKDSELKKLFYFVFIEYMICNVLRNIHFLILKNRNRKVIKIVQNSKMLLDLHDKGISRDLYQFGIRKRTSTEMMKKILNQNKVVVDIGANIGYYALIEASMGAKVYAIEPVPDNYDVLNKNIELNKYENVKTYNLAIGDETGKKTMYLSEKTNLHSMINKKGESIQVNIETLDAFLSDKELPDIIRMDVEGYEYEILQGMGETLKKMKNGSWLFIEIHDLGSKRARSIFKILSEEDFILKKNIKECKESPLFSYRTYRDKFPRLNFKPKGVAECFFQKNQ
jgi:FkbM family methyltransferase